MIRSRNANLDEFEGQKSGTKLGSKMVQVKGVMPPRGGITRETPTGRAVGAF